MTNEERQQAIEWLKRRPVMTAGAKRMHNLAVEALEAYVPDMNVGKWIPVSERLPDEDYWTGENFYYSADVLMTVYNAEDEETIIDCGYTIDGRWCSDTTDCFVPSWWEVLAWMPLPEPWEGE